MHTRDACEPSAVCCAVLCAGTEVNAVDADGRSALSIACMCLAATEQHRHIVELLLEHGARVCCPRPSAQLPQCTLLASNYPVTVYRSPLLHLVLRFNKSRVSMGGAARRDACTVSHEMIGIEETLRQVHHN